MSKNSNLKPPVLRTFTRFTVLNENSSYWNNFFGQKEIIFQRNLKKTSIYFIEGQKLKKFGRGKLKEERGNPGIQHLSEKIFFNLTHCETIRMLQFMMQQVIYI